MESLINEILKKHDIQDEKLANALAEIFELLNKESQRQSSRNDMHDSVVDELKMNMHMKGRQF